MTLFTLKDIADQITRVDGRSAEIASAAHQALRYVHQNFGLLMPTDSAGPRGAWRFNEKERDRARLLHVLLEMGIPRHLLADVNAGLNAMVLDPEIGTGSYFDVVRRDMVERPKIRWELRISIIRSTASQDITLVARVYREGETSQEVFEGLTAADLADAKVGKLCAHLILPMTLLLKPFFAAAGN